MRNGPVAREPARAIERPETFDRLRGTITERYDTLSRRLQQIAEYALAHPDDMALETIAVIAARAQVPPSSLIRFAKAFGFEGFTEMQRVFRTRLVERAPTYGERIRGLRGRHGRREGIGPAVLDEFASQSIAALDRLRREMPGPRLDRAIALLARAEVVHVAAQRRAFPVAAYLAYLLGQLGRRTHLLDSVGGMLEQQGRAITTEDVLLAVSFRSYSPEIMALVERCRSRDVPVIGLTDSPLSPLARSASVSLEVVEAEVEAFRPLAASMCLALALVVALGHHLHHLETIDGADGDDDNGGRSR